MKILTLLSFTCLTALTASAAPPSSTRPNVLFVAVDDLNCWINCMGSHYGVITPHLDQMAKEGVSFVNAHCASPCCHPSRVAVLTGCSPQKTGVVRNWHTVPTIPSWRLSPVLTNAVTLPEYFKAMGYEVKGGGKIFHATQYERYNENDPTIWDDYFPSRQQAIPFQPTPPFDFFKLNKQSGRPQGYLDWTPLKIADNEMSDYKVVDWALSEIKKEHANPFFLAVGLFRPHVPFQVPEKYYELYPPEKIPQPPVYPAGVTPAPAVMSTNIIGAFGRSSYLWARDTHNVTNAVRGYLASVTFCDTMLGRLLTGLRESRYGSNTVIVLFSDNGYHLTEKERFEKFTLWKESTRVPLLIVAPNIARPGGICREPVSLLDLFPTLVELCGGRPFQQLDGETLVPWLTNPAIAKSTPVYTFGSEPGNLAMVSKQFRYISYFNGSEELYDLQKDPDEFINLSTETAYQEVLAGIRKSLPHRVAEFTPPGAIP